MTSKWGECLRLQNVSIMSYIGVYLGLHTVWTLFRYGGAQVLVYLDEWPGQVSAQSNLKRQKAFLKSLTNLFLPFLTIFWGQHFLQRVSIACYAERCISYDRFCLTVWPSVTRWYHAKTTPATIVRSSLEDSPMTLVSWRLTSSKNSKGNIGSEGAEWERGSKNVAKIGNF